MGKRASCQRNLGATRKSWATDSPHREFWPAVLSKGGPVTAPQIGTLAVSEPIEPEPSARTLCSNLKCKHRSAEPSKENRPFDLLFVFSLLVGPCCAKARVSSTSRAPKKESQSVPCQCPRPVLVTALVLLPARFPKNFIWDMQRMSKLSQTTNKTKKQGFVYPFCHPGQPTHVWGLTFPPPPPFLTSRFLVGWRGRSSPKPWAPVFTSVGELALARARREIGDIIIRIGSSRGC